MSANTPAGTAAQEPEQSKKAQAYSLERLAKDCFELFGVSPSTFAGATCGLKPGKDKKYTVAEMKEIIEKWLKKPIKAKKKEGK